MTEPFAQAAAARKLPPVYCGAGFLAAPELVASGTPRQRPPSLVASSRLAAALVLLGLLLLLLLLLLLGCSVRPADAATAPRGAHGAPEVPPSFTAASHTTCAADSSSRECRSVADVIEGFFWLLLGGQTGGGAGGCGNPGRCRPWRAYSSHDRQPGAKQASYLADHKRPVRMRSFILAAGFKCQA